MRKESCVGPAGSADAPNAASVGATLAAVSSPFGSGSTEQSDFGRSFGSPRSCNQSDARQESSSEQVLRKMRMANDQIEILASGQWTND
jgi:hypothetical protein